MFPSSHDLVSREMLPESRRGGFSHDADPVQIMLSRVAVTIEGLKALKRAPQVDFLLRQRDQAPVGNSEYPDAKKYQIPLPPAAAEPQAKVAPGIDSPASPEAVPQQLSIGELRDKIESLAEPIPKGISGHVN